MPRATVLVADDHAVVAEGLASLLRGEFSLVGTVTDGAQLLEAARRLRPDVIVTDMAMPGLSGLDVQLAAEALRAGASGFVVKSVAGKELVAAIHTVLRGKTYLTGQLAQDVLAELAAGGTAGGAKVTPRQREVLRLIAAGRTMKEVAAILGLSPRTVETHKYQVMEALGLGTTAELVRYAIEHGLATPPPDPPPNR